MIGIPLKHIKFDTTDDENEFYNRNPGVHLVKAVVVGKTTHLWVADNRKMNGGHMQVGGSINDG